jgi:hypothetical protein
MTKLLALKNTLRERHKNLFMFTHSNEKFQIIL